MSSDRGFGCVPDIKIHYERRKYMETTAKIIVIDDEKRICQKEEIYGNNS